MQQGTKALRCSFNDFCKMGQCARVAFIILRNCSSNTNRAHSDVQQSPTCHIHSYSLSCYQNLAPGL